MNLSVRSFLSIFTLLIFVSCKTTKSTPVKNEEPLQRNFLYYDSAFKLSPQSKLRTDGLYFHLKEEDLFGDTHFIFRFYPDGGVIEYNVYNSPEKIVQLERRMEGNLHGYYKTMGDTILLSTAVYYDNQQNFYKGIIYRDSIVLMEDRFNAFPGAPTTYYFFGEQ